MNGNLFPNLFTSLKLGGKEIKNRIMSTGHDTMLPAHGEINDAYLAYQESRAIGGVGLIVLQVTGVHETARYTSHSLMATEDSCVPGYKKMADVCHSYGTAVFAQLFHPGREIMETETGLLPVAYSASAVPQERFHVMPRELSIELIEEIVQGYANAASRLEAAGIDGAEIVASHGYLPSQFLNSNVNQRCDQYGGSEDNRLRFLQEVIERVRGAVGVDFVVGLRISCDELDDNGLPVEEVAAALLTLQDKIDYVSVTGGTSASLGGAIHIVPPMAIENAYLASDAKRLKQKLKIPVLVTGRINQPQEAEAILVRGEADMCGMTRALICDPRMPEKADQGRVDDIRACIGCNQACIGHFHKGYPISCIQYPESGRELQFGFGDIPLCTNPKNIMVIGGGPAGMKAASTIALAGHNVSLYEANRQMGGQVRLAQLVPGRNEFGGLITNLSRELELANVIVNKNCNVDLALIEKMNPDVVVIATGAKPYVPHFERLGAMPVLSAWDILQSKVKPGNNVVIADWRCDWVGIGLAELLARNGCSVRLAVNGLYAGETLPAYTRDHSVAKLHQLGVKVIPYMRLYGCDDDTVYFQHTASKEPVFFKKADSLVLCQGHSSKDDLVEPVSKLTQTHLIGDALAPRTAEEAVYDGLRVGWEVIDCYK